MHKLLEYVCDELETLEKKTQNGGKLSMAEIQYADTLAHTKKNLLKSDEMMGEGYSMNDGMYSRNGYSRYYADNGNNYGNNGSYDNGGSYARGRGRNARRDSMGRYSRNSETENMVEELRGMMEDAPDEKTKQEFQRFIQRIEQM